MTQSTETNDFDKIPSESETGKLATMTTEEQADYNAWLDEQTGTISLRD